MIKQTLQPHREPLPTRVGVIRLERRAEHGGYVPLPTRVGVMAVV